MKISLNDNDKILIKIIKAAPAQGVKSDYYAQVKLISGFSNDMVDAKLVNNGALAEGLSSKQIVSINNLIGLGIVCNDFDSNCILDYLESNNYTIEITEASFKPKRATSCECAILDENKDNKVVARYKNIQDLSDSIWAMTF